MKKIFTCIIMSLIISAIPTAIFANDIDSDISQSVDNEMLVDSSDQQFQFHKEFFDREFARNKWLEGLTDVEPETWYYPVISVIYDTMKGVSETEFAPNDFMTRAMFATVLDRMSSDSDSDVIANKESFNDVYEDDWYAAAVNRVVSKGILKGIGDNRFDPDGKITREQIALALRNLAVYSGRNISNTSEAKLSSYEDYNKVSEWAENAMMFAVGHEILKGYPEDNTLKPKNNATRAEVAQIIYNYTMVRWGS